MLEMLQHWYRRHFSNPQSIALAMLLLTGFGALYFFSTLLAPLLVTLVLAYLLEWPIAVLQRCSIPRSVALPLILVLFFGLLLLFLFGLLPHIWQQGLYLMQDLPTMFNSFQDFVLSRSYYSILVDAGVMGTLTTQLQTKLLLFGTSIVKHSMTSLITVMKLAIYLILVPIMLFFMLKDKQQLLGNIQKLLPDHQGLARQVWQMMDQQIRRYIGGKVLEMLLVTLVTYGSFAFFQLRYALLLAIPVGLSVLIPYVGALLATLPVALVALFQWGLTPHFCYFIAIYILIQGLDANVLVPILFSETLNLHPLVIIVSTLIFGSLWGFWGLFFAIPLATLVKTVFTVWPATETKKT
jgi:putative permease